MIFYEQFEQWKKKKKQGEPYLAIHKNPLPLVHTHIQDMVLNNNARKSHDTCRNPNEMEKIKERRRNES